MVVQQLLAKPDGAPDTAAVCDSMAPGHRSPPQTSPVPFVINLSQDYYSRSTTTLKGMLCVIVSHSGKDGKPDYWFLFDSYKCQQNPVTDIQELVSKQLHFFIALIHLTQ